MSRSRRRHPFRGITTARSDKSDKVLDHRQERAQVRDALAHRTEPEPRPRGQYFAKDGKMRFDRTRYPELMRK